MPSLFLPVEHVQQHQDGECLAACAAMVLNFTRISVSYHRLLKVLDVESGFGTPAFKIRNLSRLGIKVDYRQGSIQELRNHLQVGQPCIVFLRTGDLPYWHRITEHAVVIVGVDDEHVYLNDPAVVLAPMQVSLGDFDLAWLERDEMYAVLTR